MKNQNKTRGIVILSLFIAMSVIGGYIKLPNPITSSIAFDSLPAYLAALLLGGVPGAIVGFLGHIISAALGGFSLTLPVHLLVASEMALIMVIFSFCAKKINIIAAIISGILLNGIIMPATLILIPGFGVPVFLAMLLPLTAASTLNILVCTLIYKPIKKAVFGERKDFIKNEL